MNVYLSPKLTSNSCRGQSQVLTAFKYFDRDSSSRPEVDIQFTCFADHSLSEGKNRIKSL